MSLRDNHDFGVEETAADWEESVALSFRGFLSRTHFRVHPEMVRLKCVLRVSRYHCESTVQLSQMCKYRAVVTGVKVLGSCHRCASTWQLSQVNAEMCIGWLASLEGRVVYVIMNPNVIYTMSL